MTNEKNIKNPVSKLKKSIHRWWHPPDKSGDAQYIADTKCQTVASRKSALTIYDTSGPFTDPNIEIDIRKGLPRIREQWILDRNDVEELRESSDYGKND
jgi:phosphomethylpyrimidine synthase